RKAAHSSRQPRVAQPEAVLVLRGSRRVADEARDDISADGVQGVRDRQADAGAQVNCEQYQLRADGSWESGWGWGAVHRRVQGLAGVDEGRAEEVTVIPDLQLVAALLKRDGKCNLLIGYTVQLPSSVSR